VHTEPLTIAIAWPQSVTVIARRDLVAARVYAIVCRGLACFTGPQVQDRYSWRSEQASCDRSPLHHGTQKHSQDHHCVQASSMIPT